MSSSSPALPRTLDPGNRSPAQRALYRLLETTIPDRAVWEHAIRRALLDAQLEELPPEFDDLVPFVRRHLAMYLGDDDRPWLISSVLEDLEAEAELARSGDDLNSSARMAVATRIPDRLPTTPAPPVDHKEDEAEPASSRIAHTVPRAPRVPREGPRIVMQKDRPAVLVVDGDRFKRSALARALVQARCDVTVLDGGEEAIAAVSGPDAIDVLIIDLDGPGVSEVLHALVVARPLVPVLAWTNAAPAVAEHVARVSGVRACAVVGRNALNVEITEALRRLLDGELAL